MSEVVGIRMPGVDISSTIGWLRMRPPSFMGAAGSNINRKTLREELGEAGYEKFNQAEG